MRHEEGEQGPELVLETAAETVAGLHAVTTQYGDADPITEEYIMYALPVMSEQFRRPKKLHLPLELGRQVLKAIRKAAADEEEQELKTRARYMLEHSNIDPGTL
jgi:hypothetical protein